MGGNSHKPDLEYITPVLLDLIKCYPQKIRFQFWGIQPPVEVASLTQVQWSPATTYRYKDFATFFQAQTADIFIAPLIDTLFNRCKSPIKFFEYSALGVPGVFSRLETYTDVITHGHNGLLVSSLDEWTNYLIQLIEDDELRFYLAKNAQETIRSNWLLSQNAFRWNETFERVFEIINSNREQDTHIVSIVRSINLQSFETFQVLAAQVAEKEHTVQSLSAQVAEKEQTVQSLSAQVSKLEFQIMDLQNGIAFLLLSRYRMFVEKWMPQGTRRRYLYNIIIKVWRVLLTEGFGGLWRKIREHKTTMKIRWILLPFIQKVRNIGNKVNRFPLVSVVIPIYDRTDVLKESIDSILNQSYGNFELILVCDGSPEETLNIVRYYERSDSRVRAFYFKNNSGNAVRGRNKAIKEARGIYLAFHDSDDVAEPDRLKYSVDAMKTYNADVVYGGWRALVDGTRNINLQDGQKIFSPDCDVEMLKKICVPCQSTVMARTDCLKDVGGLKEKMRYREDHELWARLAYFDYKFKSIDKILTNLRLHQNNLEIAFKDNDDYWYNLMQTEYMKKQRMRPKIGYVVPGTGISGGIAVICQHVNRLLLRGYDVTMISEDNLDSIPWFPNQMVEVVPINKAPDNYDILVATGWSTAYSVNQMCAPRKFYFVQSDESRFFDKGDKNVTRAWNTYSMDFEFITMAKWIQKWLKDEFGKTAINVPNGIDETIIHPADPVVEKESRVRVLLEGPIDIPFKGMEDAFKAVEGLDCEVWCVSSSGKPMPEWKCDRFFEKVLFSEMKYIYSSCDILLKMSRVESFSYPPLEMMACGGAVVVGKVTGIEEYIVDGYNAIVVEQGDIKGARDAIKRLIEDDKLRLQLSENGKETAKQWRWESTIDLLESLFYTYSSESANEGNIVDKTF